MKRILMAGSLAIGLLAEAQWGLCQGTFVNLDFESPILPLVPAGDGQVPIADAMPGWMGYIGPNPTDRVAYDTISLGSAFISLNDTNKYIQILQGTYTVWLQVSFPGGAVVPAIGQVGTLPSDARSLRFYATGAPTVSFAGHPIPLFLLGSTPTYGIFGGDVSAFANQSGELLFSGNMTLDNITFSNEAIPEPTAFGLSVLGILAFGLSRRSRGKL